MADPARSGTSPAVAALFSGAVSVLLTVVATLVSLRNEADKKQLFDVLNWVMYATGATTFLVLLWLISTTLNQRLDELRSLRRLDRHVTSHVRMVKRTEHLEVFEDGSGRWIAECEVQTERDVAVAWLAFPIFSSAQVDAEPWRSVQVRRLTIDNRDYDVQRSYIRRSRAFVEGALFKASQNKGEHADTQESILQSSTCRHATGVHWHSTSTKLGYRYEIRFLARRLARTDSSSG